MYWRFLLCFSQLLGQSPASAAGQEVLTYEAPKNLSARIYSKNGERAKPLFTFKRTAVREGSRLNVLREYHYPDGKIAARERVVYEGNQLVSYALEELQIEATGSAKLQRDSRNPAKAKILFQYGTATESEALQKDTLIADMIGPFLSSHWDSLVKGEKVKCRYIVVPRKETVGFTFKKQSEETRCGQPVLVVKMEASSPILSSLVDPLFFVLERQGSHRVLEYVGRTTPKLRQGNRWKDLDAVTVFDWD